MSGTSAIEWTQATWNPIVGCSIFSPGCKGCYAMKDAWRLMHNPNAKVAAKFAGTAKVVNGHPVWTGRINLDEAALLAPLKRAKPTMYFVNSMSDLFHEGVADETIDRIFAVMALCPQHTFQVLTKRSARMRQYMSDAAGIARIIDEALFIRELPHNWRWPLSNVWLGVSVEDQQRADERVPDLLATPAAVRFLSCEPLIGPVSLTNITGAARSREYGSPVNGWSAIWRNNGIGRAWIDWVIVGGENGPRARAMHPDWARSLRDQCAAASVPFFFKQWGRFAPLPSCGPVEGEGNANTAWPDGTFGRSTDDRGGPGIAMFRGSKAVTGRVLDGALHDGMPA